MHELDFLPFPVFFKCLENKGLWTCFRYLMFCFSQLYYYIKLFIIWGSFVLRYEKIFALWLDIKLHRKILWFQGDFREDNFNTAMQVLRDAGDLAKGDQKGRKGGTKGNLELCFKRILHVNCIFRLHFLGFFYLTFFPSGGCIKI